MALEGEFELYNSPLDAQDAIYEDGVPRYAVCFGDQLRRLCDEHEHVREGVALYLKPAALSPWYYVNSSEGAPVLGVAHRNDNLRPQFPLMCGQMSEDDVLGMLRRPASCSIFKLSSAVKKGSEILIQYVIKDQFSIVEVEDTQDTGQSRGGEGEIGDTECIYVRDGSDEDDSTRETNNVEDRDERDYHRGGHADDNVRDDRVHINDANDRNIADGDCAGESRGY